jgi:O-antigen ligase
VTHPLQYPLKKLFWLTVLLIPFSSTKAFLPLGELKNDAAIIFGLFGIVLFCFYLISSKKTFEQVPLINRFIYIFILFCLLGVLVNINEINHSYFKGKYGLSRVVSQLGIFITYSIFIVQYYVFVIKQYTLHDLFKKLEKIIIAVFIFSTIYALIEIAYGIYGIHFVKGVFVFLTDFIFKEFVNAWNLNRIAGVTQEPPFLAMYLIFVAPWIFWLFLKLNGFKKYIGLFFLFYTILYAASRTGYVVLTFQFFIFLLLAIKYKLYSYKIVELSIFFIIGIITLLLFKGPEMIERVEKNISSITDKSKANKSQISNITRWGSQRASYNVFKSNPVIGVGIGQQGFHTTQYFTPEELKIDYELRYYKDPNNPIWPPGYSMLTRLLAETGLIGALLFFGFNIALLYQLYQKMQRIANEYKAYYIIVFVGLIGFIINYLQFDSFRLIGYWLYVALAYTFIQNKK